MWSLLRTRRWMAFTALVVVAIAAFGFLSRWQWQRAEEERLARQEWSTQASRAPQQWGDAAATSPEWTPTRATGRFDPSSTVLVRQRPLDGRNGFWVATALDTPSGRVWINRGWIPTIGAATGFVDAPAPPTGTVTVDGRVRRAESSGEPPPPDLPPGQVDALDPARLGATATTVYIEATASDPGDPAVLRIPAPVIDETQNISYALQWMAFAAVAVAGWWFFLRREAQEDAREEATSPAGAA